MIKLIVSDMDGTLFNDKKEIDSEIFDLIPKLQEKGIRFAVSSGRQYESLRKTFIDFADEMVFMCDNGAFAIEKGAEVYARTVEDEIMGGLIDSINKIDGIVSILSCKYSAYADNKEVFEYFAKPPLSYTIELVDDLHTISDALKITAVIYDESKSAKHYRDELIKIMPKDCHAVTSGFSCIDIGLKGVNKGSGLAILQEKLGITPEETMVFGDEENDVEMFAQAYYSYAMEGATDEIKKHARFVAPSNNKNGVSTTIKEVLKDIL